MDCTKDLHKTARDELHDNHTVNYNMHHYKRGLHHAEGITVCWTWNEESTIPIFCSYSPYLNSSMGWHKNQSYEKKIISWGHIFLRHAFAQRDNVSPELLLLKRKLQSPQSLSKK